MALKSQTTQLFIIDPSGESSSVIEVGAVTDISGIDAPISAVETTTLASDHREYIAGVAEPASASFKVNLEPGNAVQAKLHQLRNAGTEVQWAVGMSDGTASPTAQGGEFDTEAIARTCVYFSGFMTTFDFNFAVNGVVESSVGVQLTNRPQLVVAA